MMPCLFTFPLSLVLWCHFQRSEIYPHIFFYEFIGFCFDIHVCGPFLVDFVWCWEVRGSTPFLCVDIHYLLEGILVASWICFGTLLKSQLTIEAREHSWFLNFNHRCACLSLWGFLPVLSDSTFTVSSKVKMQELSCFVFHFQNSRSYFGSFAL